MGTPLPPNYDDALCIECWGPGKTFGDTPTPHVIVAALTRILPGDHWIAEDEQQLLTSHYLIQQQHPCEFRIDDGTFEWFLFFADTHTQFSVSRHGSIWHPFFHGTDQHCELDLDNELTGPSNNEAYGGFVNLYWNVEDLV